MVKEKAHKYISENIGSDEELIGFFQAVQPFKIWLFFIIGPLAVFSMKFFFLAVTNKGVYFFRLNYFDKFVTKDLFLYREIKSLEIGKGMLQRPMKFTFANDKVVKVKAQLKGVDKIAKLLPETQEYLEKQFPQEK